MPVSIVVNSAARRMFLNPHLGTWEPIQELGSPQKFQENTDAPVEVTGLHWLEPKQNQLIAVYKSHGAQ